MKGRSRNLISSIPDFYMQDSARGDNVEARGMPRRLAPALLDPLPISSAIYLVSVGSSSPVKAFRFCCTRSCLLSRAALVFARLASISSLRSLSRAFSAFALWICESIEDQQCVQTKVTCSEGEELVDLVEGNLTCSIRARLCLKVFPLLR